MDIICFCILDWLSLICFHSSSYTLKTIKFSFFFLFTGREFEGEEEFLEILGITREQSGKYECKAANEVSTADVKQVRVTVNCELFLFLADQIKVMADQIIVMAMNEKLL